MLELGLADQFATAAIETTMNILIKDNPEHERQTLRLKGQVVQIHLIELNKKLTFVFSDQVDVLTHYEGIPDCVLSIQLSVLPQLRNKNNITRLIKQEKMELEGDLQLAQQFSQLLSDSKPDLEEWVSRLTGDIVAHTLVQSAKDAGQWIKKQTTKHKSTVSQILTEEWAIAPSSLEVAYLCDQIADIQKAADKVEKRLDSLMKNNVVNHRLAEETRLADDGLVDKI